MICDVTAAAGLVHIDAPSGKQIGRGENMRSAAVASDAERQDVRVLDEHQQIADAAGLPILDERTLHGERVGVPH